MTCQGISNGDFECRKNGSYSHVNHFGACKNATYISSHRLKQFGVDCCIEEARHSMDDFYEISSSINFTNNTEVSLASKFTKFY